jgi:hypothetical protein
MPHARRRGPYSSLPFPFFGDSFNPDDIYSTGYPVASEPPAFLSSAMRGLIDPSANAMGSAISPPNAPSSQPLLIELQGGRYVRVTSNAIDGEALPLNLSSKDSNSQVESASSDSRHISRTGEFTAAPLVSSTSSRDVPPAILIFRDGHTEEIREYTITDGSLYARGDFYTQGYWNKKIDLAALNVPETVQANASRNVNFTLPSSPNEVIVRP